MAIGSPEINKVLRRYVRPVLIENGFDITEPRKAWGWHEPCIWAFNIRAVGSYFSDVTGWPPASVGVTVGVFYEFIPLQANWHPKIDAGGRLRPDVASCHRIVSIHSSLDQSSGTSALDNPAERARTDLWWIEEDGSNLADVAENIFFVCWNKASLGSGRTLISRKYSRSLRLKQTALRSTEWRATSLDISAISKNEITMRSWRMMNKIASIP